MKKGPDEEETKKSQAEKASNMFAMDFSKYQGFIEEVVRIIYNII